MTPKATPPGPDPDDAGTDELDRDITPGYGMAGDLEAGPEWVSVAVAARRAKRSPRTIKRLVAEGILTKRSTDPEKQNAPILVRWPDLQAHYELDAPTGGLMPIISMDEYRALNERLADLITRAVKAEAKAEHLEERLTEARKAETRLRLGEEALEAELELAKNEILTRRQRRRLAARLRDQEGRGE